jgi:hypothetical protein
MKKLNHLLLIACLGAGFSTRAAEPAPGVPADEAPGAPATTIRAGVAAPPAVPSAISGLGPCSSRDECACQPQ